MCTAFVGVGSRFVRTFNPVIPVPSSISGIWDVATHCLWPIFKYNFKGLPAGRWEVCMDMCRMSVITSWLK